MNYILLIPLLLQISIIYTQDYSYSYSSCSSTQILNIKTLQCESCPTNMRPSMNQNIPTYCVCQSGYYSKINHQCTQAATSGNLGETTFADIYQKDGSFKGVQSNYVSCTSTAYSNENGTGCTPCPINMQYSEGQGCICIDSSQVKTLKGCFSKNLTSSLSLSQSNSDYYEQLKYLLPGCYAFKDLLSCSYLVNLCTYSHVDDSPECNFFNNLSDFQSYMYPTDTNFQMSPGTFSFDTALNFKLLFFLPTGNYVKQKNLRLPDIMRCGVPTNNSISILIGNNIQVQCTFNFNYLIQKLSTHTYQNYLYELFIQGEDSNYYQIPIQIGSASKTSKRFYLQNTYSSNTQISVLTSLQLSFEMNTTGYLTNPLMTVDYTSLQYQNGLITPDTDKQQTISYSINFFYDLTNFWTSGIVIFAILNVVVLAQSIVRSYIAYLNRESPLAFLFYFAKFWSLWMFYFLFAFSGYWFIATKATQQLYVFVPDSQSIFYPIFYAIAALMIVFRIITVLIQKNEKLNYEVFMINWQKGHFKNSWRQIFIINSMAEFYTYRTISLFYMLLCMMFFLVGLQWQQNAAEVTHTDISTIYSFNPKNRVFLYFLGCGVFLVVGAIFKILRRLSVIQWPYPFEDFVDYCNVTNISFFFIKKKSSQAYYIHAAIQDRVEVTYKQINQAIRRGLSKNRTIANETSFADHQRLYNVYISKDIEDKFNAMLRKQDEEKDQSQNINKTSMTNKKLKNKHILNPREQFVQKKLKPHLQVINREGSNKTKTMSQRLFGYPPVDLRDPASTLKTRSQVIFDDNLQLVRQVFPNGDQFQQIHTLIIIFLAFVILSASVSIAAFVTYFIDAYLINGWISQKCQKNLQRMTKVKEGFML